MRSSSENVGAEVGRDRRRRVEGERRRGQHLGRGERAAHVGERGVVELGDDVGRELHRERPADRGGAAAIASTARPASAIAPGAASGPGSATPATTAIRNGSSPGAVVGGEALDERAVRRDDRTVDGEVDRDRVDAGAGQGERRGHVGAARRRHAELERRCRSSVGGQRRPARRRRDSTGALAPARASAQRLARLDGGRWARTARLDDRAAGGGRGVGRRRRRRRDGRRRGGRRRGDVAGHGERRASTGVGGDAYGCADQRDRHVVGGRDGRPRCDDAGRRHTSERRRAEAEDGGSTLGRAGGEVELHHDEPFGQAAEADRLVERERPLVVDGGVHETVPEAPARIQASESSDEGPAVAAALAGGATARRCR